MHDPAIDRRAPRRAGTAARLTGLTLLILSTCAVASPQAMEPAAPDPYAVFDALIGEWEVSPAGGPPAFVEQFSWGPERAYVWTRVLLLRGLADEHLHFEGMIAWNAATKRFDYLFVVEPGSLTQERGEFHVEPDGMLVRDVLLTGPTGAIAEFRQTFLALAGGRFATTLMRKRPDGWEPSFPGSDALTMVRRPASS
jgi:hypothetical protein